MPIVIWAGQGRDSPLVYFQQKQNHTVSKKKGFGCLKDIPCKMSPDFDEPLEEFSEYM